MRLWQESYFFCNRKFVINVSCWNCYFFNQRNRPLSENNNKHLISLANKLLWLVNAVSIWVTIILQKLGMTKKSISWVRKPKQGAGTDSYCGVLQFIVLLKYLVYLLRVIWTQTSCFKKPLFPFWQCNNLCIESRSHDEAGNPDQI